MNICYECIQDDNIDKLENEMNYCLMKVRESIFNDVYTKKNEDTIKKILTKMLIETCEFIISRNNIKVNF